jgi:hypothetical protein
MRCGGEGAAEAIRTGLEPHLTPDAALFVAGMATDMKVHESVLDALMETDLALYAEALRFGADTSAELVELPQPALTERYLGVYRRSFSGIVSTHLGALKARLSPWRYAPYRPHTAPFVPDECELGIAGTVAGSRGLTMHHLILPPGADDLVRATQAPPGRDNPEYVGSTLVRVRWEGTRDWSPRGLALGNIKDQLLGMRGLVPMHGLREEGVVLAEAVRAAIEGGRRLSTSLCAMRAELSAPPATLLAPLSELPEHPTNEQAASCLGAMYAACGRSAFYDAVPHDEARPVLSLPDALDDIRRLSAGGMEAYSLAPPPPDVGWGERVSDYVVDAYSDTRLRELMVWLFESVLAGYKVMVEANFPTLKHQLSLYSQLPVKCLCRVTRPHGMRGFDELGHGHHVFMPVPEGSTDALRAYVTVNQEDPAELTSAFDQAWDLLGELGRRGRYQSTTLYGTDVSAACRGSMRHPHSPVANLVYALIEDDLERVLDPR